MLIARRCTFSGNVARSRAKRNKPESRGKVELLRRCEVVALYGSRQRTRHDTGIVDEKMKRASPFIDEPRDRGAVDQVQPSDMDPLAARRRGDVLGNAMTGIESANGQHNLGTGTRQRARRLDADTRRGSRHDGALSGKIDTGQNVVGRAFARKFRHDPGQLDYPPARPGLGDLPVK